MIKHGARVTIGLYGKVVYTAHLTGWRYADLIPVHNGRTKFRVPIDRLVEYKPVSPVLTSRGVVKRPIKYKKYDCYSGSTRTAYIGPKWVWKVPRGNWGTEQNRLEAAVYAYQQGMPIEEVSKIFGREITDQNTYFYRFTKVPVAECYLLEDESLVMERVRPVYNINRGEGADELTREEKTALGYKEPDWICNVDSGQVGYDRHNRVVAYDL